MSGMVRTDTEVGKQQLFAARMRTSAVWFHGHKNGVNIFERLGVAGLQNPALLADVVFVQNAETKGLLLVRSSPAPRLKRTRVPHTGLGVEVEGIKDQPLSLGVKHAALRLVRPFPGNVANIRHIEIARAH